jgi:SET domain-containing protein
MALPDLPFEIRSSPIQGMGAFATRAIPAGARLIEYAGQRLTPAEAEARYPDVAGERHHTFLFAIDDDVVIDAAVEGNEARFINHSCDPNCDAIVEEGRIWIETIRDVAPGEELQVQEVEDEDGRERPELGRGRRVAQECPDLRADQLADARKLLEQGTLLEEEVCERRHGVTSAPGAGGWHLRHVTFPVPAQKSVPWQV